MPDRALILRITDIIEAIERIRTVLIGVTLETFEADWQKRWLVETRCRDHIGGQPSSQR
jgi:uncharacterized protein with HEPN domain